MFVDAIYQHNLLDKKIGLSTFGFLFFLSPFFLFLIKKNIKSLTYIFVLLFLLCQGISPWLPTPLRIVSTGIGVSVFLLLFALILSGNLWEKANLTIGMAFATLLSITLRALGSTVDISLSDTTIIIGWFLIILTCRLLWRLHSQTNPDGKDINFKPDKSERSLYFFVTGIFSVIVLIYFTLASPGVFSRWTGANYLVIHIILSVSTSLIIFLIYHKILPGKLKKWHLVMWNILFSLTLILSICLHMITPPQSPEANPLVVYNPVLWKDWITYGMLLLSPILFINISLFTQKLIGKSPATLAGPFIVSTGFLIILILIIIFTNIWGYAGIIGRVFRHAFYLPFSISALGMLFPYCFIKIHSNHFVAPHSENKSLKTLPLVGIILCILIIGGVLSTQSTPLKVVPEKKELILMTYNLQQGVDYFGIKNYQQQLIVIKKINPDILCLQESDVTRISGGNSDIVRYLADKLNYYSYYGPKTVTGTFGTAILSRLPFSDCKSIFTYSDKDEIGTAVCYILIDEEPVLVINNHPDGSDTSKQSHIDMLMGLLRENDHVLSMGDYNFTQTSSFYKQITSELTDSWLAVYPDGNSRYHPGDLNPGNKDPNTRSSGLLSDNRTNMSERIDHIFVSKSFKIIQATYLPVPESASDHPAHWVVVRWENN